MVVSLITIGVSRCDHGRSILQLVRSGGVTNAKSHRRATWVALAVMTIGPLACSTTGTTVVRAGGGATPSADAASPTSELSADVTPPASADTTPATPVTPAPAPPTTQAVPTTTAAPPAAPTTTAPPPPLNLYAETTVGKLAASVRDIPLRVYVPNSEEGSVTVIDPATFAVVAKFRTGSVPHHVTPSWDMQTLYVLNTSGDTITPLDPRSGQPGQPIPVVDPYNLYFTPDGHTAIVVAERYQRLDLRNPVTWELSGSISVPRSGVDHGDFSPDGRFFYASCEWSGYVEKIDLVERRIVVEARVGSLPIDVKLAPDASVVYVADQGRGGVMVLDPGDLHEIAFIPTGRGAHGLYPSRDTTKLYVANRLGGSVSVIDFATRTVEATWTIPGGGSPDMGGVSPDGSQLWLSGRFHSEVYVFDTRSGQLIQRLRAGAGAHGLAIFPQPGRFSLGHTGVYR